MDLEARELAQRDEAECMTLLRALDALAREPVLEAEREEMVARLHADADHVHECVLKQDAHVAQLEEREKLLVGLLRVVADEGPCSSAVENLCPEHWPENKEHWCPSCLVRDALDEKEPT